MSLWFAWAIIIIITFILLCSCVAKKEYSTKRGLMILEQTQLGRNKALYSHHNKSTKAKMYRKYKKNNKYWKHF